MTISSDELRSKLAKARGMGSAHDGIHHWWLQRLTAVALIPLSLWFVYALVTAMLGAPKAADVQLWFASPINTVAMLLMIVAMFWHAKLGLQVVIEDYVHSEFAKYTLLLANVFICFVFAAISVLAVLKLHFLDVGAGSI